MGRIKFLGAAVTIIGLSLLVILTQVSVWVGSFPLTISIESNSPLGTKDLKFAMCWTYQEAQHAVEFGSNGDVAFHRFASIDGSLPSTGELVATVPCSGRSGPIGFLESHRRPKFLVLEYPSCDGEQVKLRRTLCKIPASSDPAVLHVVMGSAKG